MADQEIKVKSPTQKKLSRRDMLTKYGPYTAPIVIALLNPSTTYGHNTGAPYSTSATCVADSAGGNMHGATMVGHCMIFGAAGGSQTHPVANPGPP